MRIAVNDANRAVEYREQQHFMKYGFIKHPQLHSQRSEGDVQMNLNEYHNLMQTKPKRHKYGAKPCIVTPDGTIFEVSQIKAFDIKVEGIRFDSKMEAEYYLHIKRYMGDIKSVTLQPDFILQEKPKIVYKADFLVTYEDGREIVIDVKGFETQAFRIKMRLFKAKFPDKVIMLVKRKGQKWISREVG